MCFPGDGYPVDFNAQHSILFTLDLGFSQTFSTKYHKVIDFQIVIRQLHKEPGTSTKYRLSFDRAMDGMYANREGSSYSSGAIVFLFNPLGERCHLVYEDRIC